MLAIRMLAFFSLCVLLLVRADAQTPVVANVEVVATPAPSAPVATTTSTPTSTEHDHPPDDQGERESWLRYPVPHPFVEIGPALMGGGYAPLAYFVETGIDVEARYFVLNADGAYDDGHKTDDGDQPNPNGHDRYLNGVAYYRLSSGKLRGLAMGGGYTWDQLSTTNYTKGGGRYQIGGFYDIFTRGCERCRRSFSMRAEMEWITAGQDWQNGSHGPDIRATFPALIEKRHWFAVEEIGIYRFHETVTEPTNLPLTESQLSQKSISCSASFGVVYRF
jgi:hypothetical protein